MYTVCICTLLKLVSYYDLSVLSMSEMGFKKKRLDGGWVGGASSIQVYFGFLEFFNFAKPLTRVGGGWERLGEVGRGGERQCCGGGHYVCLLLFLFCSLTAFVLSCMFRFNLLNAFDFVNRLFVLLLLHVFIVMRVLS